MQPTCTGCFLTKIDYSLYSDIHWTKRRPIEYSKDIANQNLTPERSFELAAWKCLKDSYIIQKAKFKSTKQSAFHLAVLSMVGQLHFGQGRTNMFKGTVDASSVFWLLSFRLELATVSSKFYWTVAMKTIAEGIKKYISVLLSLAYCPIKSLGYTTCYSKVVSLFACTLGHFRLCVHKNQ